jgi:S1-C subfamily serine protease
MRPGTLSLLVVVVVACSTAVFAQGDSTTRVWKDKTGSFRLEATLERATADKITLRRKDDGRVIEVNIANLSEADVEFVKSRLPELFREPEKRLLTASALENAAQRRRYAVDALAMYDAFISDERGIREEKELAKAARERWAVLAAAKKVRVGSKWLTPAEYKDLVNDEIALLRHLYDFRAITDWNTFESKLKQASQLNPASIRADLIRGFLAALQGRPAQDEKERYVRRSAAEAEDRFAMCVRRLTDYQADLTPPERANLAACYNNLALSLMRQRKYAEALRSWQRCLEASPANQAVLHNLGQFEAISNQGLRSKAGIVLTTEETLLLRRILKSMGGISAHYDRTRGWRYIPTVAIDLTVEAPSAPAPTEKTRDTPAGELLIAAGGTGFVVGNHMVVTNRHVTNDFTTFAVRRDGEDNSVARPARLIAAASDPKVDLAVLRADTMDAPAVAITKDVPRLSREIRTLGFPEFFDLGNAVKVSSGIITALPPLRGIATTDWEDFLMHDAVTAPGSSGGPVFDNHGLIVGVHTGSMMQKFKVAVTASTAANFLSPLVTDLQIRSSADSETKNWEDIVAAVRDSTVHVLCFARPARFSPVIAPLAGDRPTKGFASSIGEPYSLRQYDDCWCLACYGSGRLDCPNRECVKGLVKTVRWDTVVLPNGAVTKQGTPLRVDCPTCRGRAVVDCDFCSGGTDPRFR